MFRAGARLAGTDSNFIDSKISLAQALGKLQVRARRPYGQHAAGTQRRVGGGQPLSIVKRVIGVSRQSVRTVVDVEQNRIEGRPAGPNQRADIVLVNADARVLQTVVENLDH